MHLVSTSKYPDCRISTAWIRPTLAFTGFARICARGHGRTAQGFINFIQWVRARSVTEFVNIHENSCPRFPVLDTWRRHCLRCFCRASVDCVHYFINRAARAFRQWLPVLNVFTRGRLCNESKASAEGNDAAMDAAFAGRFSKLPRKNRALSLPEILYKKVIVIGLVKRTGFFMEQNHNSFEIISFLVSKIN